MNAFELKLEILVKDYSSLHLACRDFIRELRSLPEGRELTNPGKPLSEAWSTLDKELNKR